MELDKLFYIQEKSWYELQGWAKLAHDEDKNEISGLMTAVPQEDGRFKLGDVEILKQENSSHNTTIDKDSVSEYKIKYAMKHKRKDMKFVWWHSHHTMEAFWSGTDENEINAWANDSFSLALVINLKEEYKFRVSLWKASGLPVAQHYDIPLTIERENKVIINDKMKTLYKELCKEEVSTNISHFNQTAFGYRRRNAFVNEDSLLIENAYEQALEEVEKLNDGFVDGTIKMGFYKKSLKKLNEECKVKKLPFSIKVPTCDKEALLHELMTSLPSELFAYQNKLVENHLENNINGFDYGY